MTDSKQDRPSSAKLENGHLAGSPGRSLRNGAGDKSSYEGSWTQKKVTTGPSYPGKKCTVSEKGIQWNLDFEPKLTPIKPLSATSFTMELGGKTYTAELKENGQLLVFDDGEEWARSEGPCKFEGSWTQKKVTTGPSYPGKKCTVSSTSIQWNLEFEPKSTPINALSAMSFTMELSGKTYTGELKENGQLLVFDDGEEWTRVAEAPAPRKFEGSWVQSKSAGVSHPGVVVVSKTHVQWPDGLAVDRSSVTVLSATSFSIVMDGKTHTAELKEEGKIVWDDGEEWVRPSEAEKAKRELLLLLETTPLTEEVLEKIKKAHDDFQQKQKEAFKKA